MAGNSQRRGAVRKTGSKKGATVGSGGQRRRGLEGKGPTPKASDRPNPYCHVASSGSPMWVNSGVCAVALALVPT